MKIGLFYLLTICFCTISFGQKKAYEKVKYPDSYIGELNIKYTKVNRWKGRIDIYSNPNAAKPTPVVLNIHGGGWRKGVKEAHKGFNSFFKRGYAVANVEYRLSHEGTAPAAAEDIRCALIYLHQNAKELNIDTNKIVIMGGSAGGHLALMGGLLGNDKRFDSNCPFEGEIKVAAIINKYGIADLSPFKEWKSAKLWLGDNFQNIEFTRSVSPINYITKDSPPVFIIHGDKDPTVPYEQSVQLHEKLISAGVTAEFMTVKNGGHGKFSSEKNNEFKKRMFTFLDSLNL